MQKNLYHQFRSCFSKNQTDIFIYTPNGMEYSYVDVELYSAKMAYRLVEAGACYGDRVMVQVDKSPMAVFLYLACLRSGLVFLPLNTAYQTEELLYLYEDSNPAVIVCSPESKFLSEMASAVQKTSVLTLDANGNGTLMKNLDGLPEIYPDVDVEHEDLAAILYTSGTTGHPKGAMLSHQNLYSNAKALHEIWGFEKNDVLLHALPIFHTHGLFVAINTTLLNASKLIFLARYDANEVIKLLPRATIMMGVPTFYTRLLSSPVFNRNVCRNVRLFISGSAPLNVYVFEAFYNRTGHKILERYGMTETNMIASNPLSADRFPGTVGLPLPDVKIRIRNEIGEGLPQGEVGGIEVKGPNVFKGYWKNQEKTDEEFRSDGYFKTGDMGMFDDNGYLRIIGRSKDLIISGGLNIYPKEVEVVLDSLEKIAETAVIGVPHPDFGEGVIAIAVSTDKSCSPKKEDILLTVKRKLASFKIPKEIFFVDALPRNAMGKVEKQKLRKQYESLFSL